MWVAQDWASGKGDSLAAVSAASISASISPRRRVKPLGGEAGGKHFRPRARQRVACLPCLKFTRRPVAQPIIVVRPDVLEPAVGLEFEERWPAAASRELHGTVRRFVHAGHVIAVALAAFQPIGPRQPPDLPARRLPHRERRIDRVEVVLADENDRQLFEDGEVDRFVEHAFFGGRIAEEYASHVIFTAKLSGQRHADGDRDRAADHRYGPQETSRDVDQVH